MVFYFFILFIILTPAVLTIVYIGWKYLKNSNVDEKLSEEKEKHKTADKIRENHLSLQEKMDDETIKEFENEEEI